MNGNLTPKELVYLCQSSHDLRKKCNNNNQEIFRSLLERDYGVLYSDVETEKTPEKLYASLEKYPNVKIHLRKMHPTYYLSLILYWIQYMDEIIAIFDDNYPKSKSPKWVNYELFEQDKISEMADNFFNQIEDAFFNGEYDIEVNFGPDMFAYDSVNVDLGESGIWDYMNKLGPVIRLNIREQDIVESR